jgi:3-methyladenine DNA glycosylase Mpg
LLVGAATFNGHFMTKSKKDTIPKKMINKDQEGCRIGLKQALDESWRWYWKGHAWYGQDKQRK